ncbi:MAG TPA: hypothetical protein V6D06_17100 [Trichocoleus sp.]
MLQSKQIVLSTFSGYLDYLRTHQPELSLDALYQVAATLTQAEFALQAAEAANKAR